MENYSTETQLRFQLPVKHFFKLNDDYCGLFILQYMFFIIIIILFLLLSLKHCGSTAIIG